MNEQINQLKLNPKLPKIILPKNKIDMFINWYNEDIRFLKEVPLAFNEGYLEIENDIINFNVSTCSEYIKTLAKQLHGTYREVENRLDTYIKESKKVTLHFKFINNNKMDIDVYGIDGFRMSNITFEIGNKSGDEDPVSLNYITELKEDWDTTFNEFNMYMLVLVVTCMWYIATTTKTTKYYYEHKEPIVYKKKDEIKVSRTKTITTPIYDMNKIKRVKVEHLIKRRKGWTYSHSFQVHGHYRHYRDGKVVFVNSYVKGKNKELQAQEITLNPKE